MAKESNDKKENIESKEVESKEQIVQSKEKEEKNELNEKEIKQTVITIPEGNNQFDDFLKSKIEKEVKLEVSKEVKKIIRNKNLIIIKRDIFILILLVCCFFLGFNLYNISDIRIDITKNSGSSKVINNKSTENRQNEDKLKDNISKYGKLLDDIYICDDSHYLKDYYNGNLTDEVKLYLAFNHLDSDKVNSDDNMVYVDSNDLKNSFEDIIDGEYKAASFKYDSSSFKYLNSKELYLYSGDYNEEKCNIKREIIDIIEGDNLVIKTVEGKVVDGKIYNIYEENEVGKSESLVKYKSSLTSVSYVFKKIDDKYKLNKIES